MLDKLVILVFIAGIALAQQESQDLRRVSSRFRNLASSTWQQNAGSEPVKVDPRQQQQQPAGDVESIEEILRRQNIQGGPKVDQAPVLQPIAGTPAPVVAARPVAQQRTFNAQTAPTPPPTIPPAIRQFLGIDNLGIPGLFGAAPPAGNDPQPSIFGGQNVQPDPSVQVQGNPTWGELASQNPDLLKQLTENGLANQPVLQSSNTPGLLTSVQERQRIAAENGRSFDAKEWNQFGFVPQQQPQADPNNFLKVMGALAQRLTQATGIREILSAGTGSAGQAAQTLVPQAAQPRPEASSGPVVAGIPKLPQNFALLPGGIPRDVNGNVDYVGLMSAIAHRVSNGSTAGDIAKPNDLQGIADNITDALLPETADVDMSKFMGRWFEGINSPRASEQRCIVHHYGGLTDNGETATFTALKIYREGSEFGQVRYSIGYAFRGGHHNGMLQMHTSEEADATPYWIYSVGPETADAFGNAQYDYAIVSNWVKYPVTVLVRDPDTFKAKYEQEVLKFLEKSGFINGFIRAFNMLEPVSYDNCQYSESTFNVFGK